MSLTWRLIISYVLIILLTLALAFLTLVLIARPIQNRLSSLRLAAQSRQVARQINQLYRQGETTATIIEQLGPRLNDRNNWLLLIDPGGGVLFDSQNGWNNQQLPLGNIAASGTFNAPTGDRYIYLAAPVYATGNTADAPSGYVLGITPRVPFIPQIITELGWGFLLAGVVALLVALLAGVLIARSFALPLQNIATAAGAIAAGDYTHRLAERGPPEITRVAASFNVMAHQVESSQQAMRDFVSNVSHELKTPLTSIQGFSQAIMEGATPDEATRQKAASIIHQEAARMSRLVEDLLDLARIDSGQVVMQKTPLDLDQILTAAFDRLRPQAIEQKVHLKKDWEQLPSIMGDGDRLAQVFTNLLDNAIRYTPADGHVTLGSRVVRGIPRPRHPKNGPVVPNASTVLSEQVDFVEVTINDTGPGIPPEELGRIFERFYQVDKSRKRGRGTGLGLAIIKEIIEAHSGHVGAESIVGLGTKFTILLPITQKDALTLITPPKM